SSRRARGRRLSSASRRGSRRAPLHSTDCSFRGGTYAVFVHGRLRRPPGSAPTGPHRGRVGATPCASKNAGRSKLGADPPPNTLKGASAGCFAPTMGPTRSDALVFSGATGDLAYKKIFPALQHMIRRGHLTEPIIGVAKAGWTLDQLRERARASLQEHGGGVDEAAFAKL